MSPQPSYHSSDLRKHRHSRAGALYSLTKTLLPSAAFSEGQRADCCESLLAFRRKEAHFLHAFVVMPDHWHALVSLRVRYPLDRLVHELCRHMSYPTRQQGGDIPWQEGFYDHQVRIDDSIVDIVRYIERNPVAAGLCSSPDEWPWSSACPRFATSLDRSFLGRERWG